jgi:hypothetical protein
MDLSHDVQVGDKVFIETNTMYWVGEVAKISFDWIILVKASWVPDTGRFHATRRCRRRL